MLVLTLFICITFSASLASRQTLKIESKYMRTTPSKHFETVTTEAIPETGKNNSTENIYLTEQYEEPITNTNKDDYSTVSTALPRENSAGICLPGQSAYKKKDLKSIIEIFFMHLNLTNGLNDSFYLKALVVRENNINHLKVFEKRFEDRPQHLKHILQDMALTRQRIEPLVKRIASLLSQYEFYKTSYRTTEEKVNKILGHLENSKKICNLNCGHDIFENLITMTSSRRLLKLNHVYCSTFDKLISIIEDRLTKFINDYSNKLDNRINKDSIMFEEKIINIKNKLKTAAVEQFGLTMYEILNLQDEYYHFSIDLKHYNISYVLQDIKQNEYEINSKLLQLESKAKIYRDYCNTCDDLVVYSDTSGPQRLARAVKIESESLLDEVLNETTNYIQISMDKQYENIFEELNRKLDETTIIEAYLAKLNPIKGQIDGEVQKEIQIFENLQSLVPKASISKVFILADRSKALLRRVEDSLFFIRQYVQ